MNKQTIRAFDLNDFPFAGGVFSPRFSSVSIIMITAKNGKLGLFDQTIQTAARVGHDIIPKGAKVSSRLLYIVKNHTQNIQGRVELIGVKAPNGSTMFFVSTEISLNYGDEITVQFERIGLNSLAENVH